MNTPPPPERPPPQGPPESPEAEVRDVWDELAEGWRIQVGDRGDVIRRLVSDPVVWRLLGDVEGLRVLDAGCGTGYLTRRLADRGARAVGVDLSGEMVALAREAYPGIDFRTDSISGLRTVADRSFDAVVSNYVLMDAPDLEGAARAFHRVLVPGGLAVVVFSHPCFPQGRRREGPAGDAIAYEWDFPYFEEGRRVDPPWAHFTREFVWFHRPLSSYWKAFTGAGLRVEAFEEPRIAPERHAEADTPRTLRKLRLRPYSVVFALRKPPA